MPYFTGHICRQFNVMTHVTILIVHDGQSKSLNDRSKSEHCPIWRHATRFSICCNLLSRYIEHDHEHVSTWILSFLIPNFTADNVSLITVPLNLAKWYLRNIQNISSELNDHSIERVSETKKGTKISLLI